MRNQRGLDERQKMLLETVVRQYISSGVPVGSKAVADQWPEALSPATIRNCMA